MLRFEPLPGPGSSGAISSAQVTVLQGFRLAAAAFTRIADILGLLDRRLPFHLCDGCDLRVFLHRRGCHVRSPHPRVCDFLLGYSNVFVRPHGGVRMGRDAHRWRREGLLVAAPLLLRYRLAIA